MGRVRRDGEAWGWGRNGEGLGREGVGCEDLGSVRKGDEGLGSVRKGGGHGYEEGSRVRTWG